MENTLRRYQYDILVSLGWPYIIEDRIIEISQYAINVHPTLLPKYRGYKSGPFILLNNEKTSGVKVHLLTNSVDAGDIISQRSFPISIFDTTKSMKRKIDEIEGSVLLDAIYKLKEKSCKLIPQNELQAGYYKK